MGVNDYHTPITLTVLIQSAPFKAHFLSDVFKLLFS